MCTPRTKHLRCAIRKSIRRMAKYWHMELLANITLSLFVRPLAMELWFCSAPSYCASADRNAVLICGKLQMFSAPWMLTSTVGIATHTRSRTPKGQTRDATSLALLSPKSPAEACAAGGYCDGASFAGTARTKTCSRFRPQTRWALFVNLNCLQLREFVSTSSFNVSANYQRCGATV